MALFTLGEVAIITKGRMRTSRLGDLRRSVRRVWADSRTCRSGDLFVALTGPRFDGHHFVADARKKGAIGALVREGTSVLGGMPLVQEDDTLRAVQEVPATHR